VFCITDKRRTIKTDKKNSAKCDNINSLNKTKERQYKREDVRQTTRCTSKDERTREKVFKKETAEKGKFINRTIPKDSDHPDYVTSAIISKQKICRVKTNYSQSANQCDVIRRSTSHTTLVLPNIHTVTSGIQNKHKHHRLCTSAETLGQVDKRESLTAVACGRSSLLRRGVPARGVSTRQSILMRQSIYPDSVSVIRAWT
jgi:hypothetical protein